VSGAGGSGAGCARVRARLEELLDGGLDPLAAARDEGHLEACAACAAERAAWLRLWAAAREAARPDPAELDFALRDLPARLAERPVPRRPPRRRVELLPLATAAAARCALLALRQGGLAAPPGADLLARLPARPQATAWVVPGWARALDAALGEAFGGGRR
jgi:anti-sigma factor RsiW